MNKTQSVRALFVDIGGVLLTDRCKRAYCGLAAREFRLDLTEMEERHHLIRTEEEWVIAKTVCRVLGLAVGKENDYER